MVLVLTTNIEEIDVLSIEYIKKSIEDLLPVDKYREIISYNDYKDVCRSVLGIALLKVYLNSCGYRIDSKLKYINGKPEICGVGIEFNISHSGNWVTCAFSKNKIGVDIERKNYNERILERCFNEKEKKYIKQSHDYERMMNNYTKSWTIKESYIKYLGIGLRYGMKKILINYDERIIEDGTDSVCFFSKEFASDYVLSVCCKARERVEIVKVGEQSLLNI